MNTWPSHACLANACPWLTLGHSDTPVYIHLAPFPAFLITATTLSTDIYARLARSLSIPYNTPSFKTKAICLASGAQYVKHLLLLY